MVMPRVLKICDQSPYDSSILHAELDDSEGLNHMARVRVEMPSGRSDAETGCVADVPKKDVPSKNTPCEMLPAPVVVARGAPGTNGTAPPRTSKGGPPDASMKSPSNA